MVFSLPLLFLDFSLKNHGIRDGNPILTGKCGPTGLPPRVKETKDQTGDESRLPSPLHLADNSAESLGPVTFFSFSQDLLLCVLCIARRNRSLLQAHHSRAADGEKRFRERMTLGFETLTNYRIITQPLT